MGVSTKNFKGIKIHESLIIMAFFLVLDFTVLNSSYKGKAKKGFNITPGRVGFT